MNETTKEIVSLLEAGRPELQVAAAQILGALRVRHPTVQRALQQAVPRSHVLGRYALDALARLGNQEALQVVVRALWENDGLADHASHLLVEVGLPAHAALAQGFAEAPPERRQRFLGILARHPSRDGMAVFARALLMPELAGDAARLLLALDPPLPAELAHKLREDLAPQLAQPLPPSCLGPILQLLGKVDPSGSRALLLRFTEASHTPEVRSAAYRALHGSKLTAAQVRHCLELLEDPQHKEVHEAVRELLGSLTEWPDGLDSALKRLLSARQPEQRLFALRALRGAGGVEMAKLALKYLDHDDERFRDAAAAALAHNKQAIEPLSRLLQVAKDPVRARNYANVLVRLRPHFAPKQVKAMAEKAARSMAAHQLVGELMFDVVMAADGEKFAPAFVEHAVRLRRGKRFPEALHLLARLAGTPHLDLEGRYQLALTKLLHDLARPHHEAQAPGNATMGFFAALVRDGFPLVDRLRKETSLPPEALLKVAAYFAETVGAERRFGAEMLQHLAQRNKGRAGEEAKQVLRAAGL